VLSLISTVSNSVPRHENPTGTRLQNWRPILRAGAAAQKTESRRDARVLAENLDNPALLSRAGAVLSKMPCLDLRATPFQTDAGPLCRHP